MLVPLAPFITIILIVFFILYFKYKQQSNYQKTMQKMLDNNVAIPERFLEQRDMGQTKSNSLKKSILLISAGLGVMLSDILFHHNLSGYWSWGFLPLMVGIGYGVVYYLIEKQ